MFQNLLRVQGTTFEPGLPVADLRAKKNPAEAFADKATRPFRSHVTSAEPRSMTENVEQLGVERIRTRAKLFTTVLIRNYVYASSGPLNCRRRSR